MTERKHRPLPWDHVCCSKCKGEIKINRSKEERYGVCQHCGWRNNSIARRGVAPSEGSANCSKSKMIRHQNKRRRKREEEAKTIKAEDQEVKEQGEASEE